TNDGLYYHELYLLFHYGDDTQQNGKNIQAIAVITDQEDVRRHITDMLQNDMLHNRGFYEAWLANTNDTFRYASPYGLDMYATAIRAQQPSTGNVSIDRSRATLAFTVQIQQGSNAYVRQRPDASSAYVGLAKAGSLYPLISTSDNGWYEIQLENGTTGFVSSKKATKVGR
ncbi:MAG: SH3 domain-containing protein, partial [Clostridia bacterium]|nr:SH3 domain-containing protein [Clostridia bacterium]